MIFISFFFVPNQTGYNYVDHCIETHKIEDLAQPQVLCGRQWFLFRREVQVQLCLAAGPGGKEGNKPFPLLESPGRLMTLAELAEV